MKTLAIEINDLGVRVRDSNGQLADSPGCALIDGDVLIGDEALAQARQQPGRVFRNYWGDLSLDPLPVAGKGAANFADLAFHHLQKVWAGLEADNVILITPASYTREQLSLLLGIARECKVPVNGLVDIALVGATQPAPGRQLMHLDLLSRQAVLTELSQGKRLRRKQVAAIDDAGQAAFFDCWANAIGDAFVRNTRFDPMHSAESEQYLYDRLPGWINEINDAGTAELVLDSGNGDQSLAIGAEVLASAAMPLYQKIIRNVTAASRPGEALSLLISDRMAGFPGLRQALQDNLPDCELVELTSDAPGSGALRRETEILSQTGSVAFVTSISWQRSSQALSPPSDAPETGVLPTHLLYRGRGWPIGNQALSLGAAADNDGRNVVLTGDLAGVSAEHCQISRRNGGVFVRDVSRHGTYLNDQRIEGETEAHYGDVLRLGGSEQVAQFVLIQDTDGT